MSSYNSDTELRLVHPNDIYRLAVILDDNDGWKKLMEVIPKDVNKRICTLANKSVGTLNNLDANNRKYDNDHVRLLENAGKRSHESRLFSQILIDEWSVSGKKNQRPTLAHLLKLLLRCHQFRAADFVADYLLKETRPQRPTNGPAAKVDTTLLSEILQDIEDNVICLKGLP